MKPQWKFWKHFDWYFVIVKHGKEEPLKNLGVIIMRIHITTKKYTVNKIWKMKNNQNMLTYIKQSQYTKTLP